MKEEAILVGARMIRETVIRPMELTDWEFRRPDGEAVIYAADGTILVFDLERLLLHFVRHEIYSARMITRIRRSGPWVTVRVKLDAIQQCDIAAVGETRLTEEARERLLLLTARVPEIVERIRTLRPAGLPSNVSWIGRA
ncbi:MAG: hypothetical protein COW24_05010 [Candidatus Kerfeldbacteria bacterium CG15_BIG_FIL_POST_REV_8_21_14_020_45_12]|uniref:Uncharacterized protein n=1 Tax=Candidatus Kerfeldbacteria bacterium CG15_BIG_FIL_POST_REV_8_21_14_020_45_12 TaxID=2014247 RepID=A0A2M7H2X2_9BACT|nr:MAG: hypothetical protein COW24_05010 [Candidatus Kerfeldbacteria bacterium CG15_BIG_FIL_POST_REV_8_21_14_020_45_12]PJA93227.1 MAG: hypothetical protein CO132_03905 [Candidatus Kerfeldbacteria bacterium CG_4_9_14_3_um_filter_45_8]